MKRVCIWLVTAVLLLAACGGGQNLAEPPDIRYGEDICDECSMIISEPRYAASYVTTTGEVHRFDDIGNMLAYDAKHHQDVHVYWVHDHVTAEWIKAEDAIFVLNPALTTPMGWGLAAFAQKAAADQFITDHGGTVVAWGTLQEAVVAGELDPGKLNAHIHQSHDEDHPDDRDHDMGHHGAGG